MVKEKRLFLIKSTLYVHPAFYVEAENIVNATVIAKRIVDYYKNETVVSTVSVLDVPLLSWEEE